MFFFFFLNFHKYGHEKHYSLGGKRKYHLNDAPVRMSAMKIAEIFGVAWHC